VVQLVFGATHKVDGCSRQSKETGGDGSGANKYSCWTGKKNCDFHANLSRGKVGTDQESSQGPSTRKKLIPVLMEYSDFFFPSLLDENMVGAGEAC
jgi:hypothetical protein